MKNTLLTVAAVTLLALAPTAMAAESVTINGRTFTCDNSCVVTVSPTGVVGVRDSAGGRVRSTIPGNEQV